MILTLKASFPTGFYLAHDGRERPEWPPSPARVTSAILATAHRLGNPGGIEVARRLFEYRPPTLWVPPHGSRDTDVRRWVPVPVELDEERGTFGRGGPAAKILKGFERGVSVGGDLFVRYADVDLSVTDVETLDRVLRAVVYLGRPTSPVVLERIDAATSPGPAHEIWRPDERGEQALRVATLDLLTELDRRERQRASMGVGAHPPLNRRPTARYRRELGPTSEPTIRADRRVVEEVSERLAYVRTPEARPDDLLAVMDALGVGEVDTAVADVGFVTQRGLEVPRLLGVALVWSPDGRPRDIAPCLYEGRVVDLEPEAVPRSPRSLTRPQRAIAAAWGSGRAWTTVCPIALSGSKIVVALQQHDADLVEVQSHGSGRMPHTPDATHHPRYQHVSVLFTRAVTGPITLGGVALMPFDAANQYRNVLPPHESAGQ